ncbi:MAG: hypothetical protein M1829_002137 [Trizodia sp. TS-e1964]|nr:MAG: hypothetical protein M1829_002137 [Trizodia sp. TS-e1964]
MLFPRAELCAAFFLSLAIAAASPLTKRAPTQKMLIGYRTVSAQQALIYQNAGGTLVFSTWRNSEQLGPGTYMTSVAAQWDGQVGSWICAVLADPDPWNAVRKAWVPEQVNGCTPLWFPEGVPNRPAYLTSVGGPDFTAANTVLFSRVAGFEYLQALLPQPLHNPGGGLGIVAQCVAGLDAAAVAILGSVYGTADWRSYPNIRGTPQ